MSRFFGFALCGVLIGSLVPTGTHAQVMTAEEGGAATGVVSPLELPGDSVEAVKPRDPFWPVGYTPKKAPKVTGKTPEKASLAEPSAPEMTRVPLWEEARKRVDIKGISLIHEKNSGVPKFLALVAGKLVETGDVVSVMYLGRLYRWRVVDISEEGVSLQKMDVRGE